MSSAFERMEKKSKKVSEMSVPSISRVRIDKLLDFVDFSDGDWHRVRVYPGIFAQATYWMDFPKQDGSITQVPKTARNFDIYTGDFDTTKKCPYAENRSEFTYRGDAGSQITTKYYANVLDRDEQDREPKKIKISKEEKKSGFKEKGSNSWTPMRVIQVPPTVVEKFQSLAKLNKRSKKGGGELSDPKKGRDVYIKYDKEEKNPGNKWDVQLVDDDDASDPLSKKEKDYLIYNIEGALKKIYDQENDEQAEKWVEDFINGKFGKKKKGKGKKKKDDFKEVKSSKKKNKKKKKEIDDDDDDLEDGDDFDLELDEKDSKKKKNKNKSPKKKASKKKTSKKKASKKKNKSPKKKTGKKNETKAGKKNVKKKKKSK